MIDQEPNQTPKTGVLTAPYSGEKSKQQGNADAADLAAAAAKLAAVVVVAGQEFEITNYPGGVDGVQMYYND